MVPASCIFIKGRGFCGRDRKVVVCVEGKSRPFIWAISSSKSASIMLEKEASVITEDEAALYDRQIRLWGLDAQKRLKY